METLILEKPGQLVAGDRPEPAAPGAGEALVRIHRVGVCGTDLHAYHGRQPFFAFPRVLGHELGVEVVEVGEGVEHLKAGDRCCVEPYLNCGTCIACRNGKPNCCEAISVLGVHQDGGMTQQLLLPARKLHPSASLSHDQLALIEPLAIGCHAVARGNPQAGETVLVIGAGPIGMAVIQFALEREARVIVMDINDERLDFCRRQLGVQLTLRADAEDVLAELRALGDGDLPTAVFDATGSPAAMHKSFELPAHGGRIVFVGLFQGQLSFEDPLFHRRELTIMGSRNALPGDFTRIIRLIEEGRIDTNPWITHRAPLGEVPGLFGDWANPATGVRKAMIHVTE